MGELIIPRGGDKPVRGIYSPEVQKVAQGLGKIETRRASHVEPTEELSRAAKNAIVRDFCAAIKAGKPQPFCPEITFTDKTRETREVEGMDIPHAWWADMLPVGGPVLGPFKDRDTALHEESEWLKTNNIPTCRDCDDSPTHKQGDGNCGIQIEPITEPVLTQADLDKSS